MHHVIHGAIDCLLPRVVMKDLLSPHIMELWAASPWRACSPSYVGRFYCGDKRVPRHLLLVHVPVPGGLCCKYGTFLLSIATRASLVEADGSTGCACIGKPQSVCLCVGLLCDCEISRNERVCKFCWLFCACRR